MILSLVSAVAAPADDGSKQELEAAVRAQKAGDLAGASARYRKILEASPRLTLARHLLAVCELQLGHLTEGIRQLEIVRQQDPSNRQAAYTLVSTYIASGMPDEARRVFDASLRSDVSAPGRFMRGSLLMASGEYASAVQELQHARRLDPNLPGLASQLGIAYCFANQLDEAIPMLEAALRENASDPNATAFLGWLYKDRDRNQEAAALLEKTVRSRPDDKGAFFLLAQLAQSRGETQRALELLEKVVALDRAFRPAHVLLARVYQQLNRLEEAARERAIVAQLNAEQQAAQPKAP